MGGPLLALAGGAASPPAGGGPFSDDFNDASINAGWTEVDANGNATFAEAGGELSITGPSGTTTDLYGGTNDAERLMQAAPAGDFTLTVRVSGLPDQHQTGAGVIAEADNGDFLRFDLYTYGTPATSHGWYCLENDGGANTDHGSGGLSWSSYVDLRVSRSGSVWTYETNVDGGGWTTRASFTPSVDPITQIGVYLSHPHASTDATVSFDSWSYA